MTPFQNRCLAMTAIDPQQIEQMFLASRDMNRETLISKLRLVCQSHERLRAELQGAEVMIETMDRKQRHGCTDANCKECDE